jgi:hypothetical protein
MQFPTRGEGVMGEESSDWSSSSEQGDCEDDADALSRPPEELSSMYRSLEEMIEELGGRVVPKMQWSCPKDAAWILPNNTIQCSTPDEVFMLLKSSDRIVHDIETLNSIIESNESPRSPLADEIEPDRESDSSQDNAGIPERSHVIALRKWYDLKPGCDFRCFVKENMLVAVCQRDVSMKYMHLLGSSNKESILNRIQGLYDQAIHKRFSLENFIFDCYVPEAETASVRIIDFTPDNIDTTNPLLFSWEDVDQCHKIRKQHPSTPEFRCIEQDIPLKPESALYGVPYDFVDSSQGSALNNLLEQARSAGI